MSRQAGSIVRGNLKAAPDIRQSGPAAGGGYVLPVGQKVKVGRTEGRRLGCPHQPAGPLPDQWRKNVRKFTGRLGGFQTNLARLNSRFLPSDELDSYDDAL